MGPKPSKQPLYVVNAVLASGVLYWVLHLSRGDRGLVDWVVVAVVVLAVLWNLVRLGQRLHGAGGGADLWHLQRTVLFWIVGLLNTALLRPEEVGGWRNWVGWAVLGIAALDTAWIFQKERRLTAARPSPGEGAA